MKEIIKDMNLVIKEQNQVFTFIKGKLSGALPDFASDSELENTRSKSIFDFSDNLRYLKLIEISVKEVESFFLEYEKLEKGSEKVKELYRRFLPILDSFYSVKEYPLASTRLSETIMKNLEKENTQNAKIFRACVEWQTSNERLRDNLNRIYQKLINKYNFIEFM